MSAISPVSSAACDPWSHSGSHQRGRYSDQRRLAWQPRQVVARDGRGYRLGDGGRSAAWTRYVGVGSVRRRAWHVEIGEVYAGRGGGDGADERRRSGEWESESGDLPAPLLAVW